MYSFSLILVSRSRVLLLKKLLESIELNTILPYEVLVGVDSDDVDSIAAIDDLSRKNIRFIVSERTPNLTTRLNELAKLSTAPYVFVLNDDCEIQNHGWDVRAKRVLDKYGPIVYGRTRDNSIDKISYGEYASFPIISREAIDKLGFFMDESYGNHGADVIAYRVFQSAGKVFDVPVDIRHVYHENQSALQYRLQEKTATEMIQRSISETENPLNKLFEYDVTENVRKLLA